MPDGMILFMKATIRAAGQSDLFAIPVRVSGYTNDAGTFVAPHTAVRHKHAPESPPSAPGLVARATFGDGRLVPVVGDKVFQTVAGAFGMPSTIHGEVIQGRNGPRIKTTGSSAMIGQAKVGATYPVDANWTVVGDPELARRTAAREAKEAEAKAQREAELAAEEAKRARAGAERGTLDPATVVPGDVIEDPEGRPHLVAEAHSDPQHGRGLYGHPLDDADGHAGGLGSDFRGWRKVDHPLPEDADLFIRDEGVGLFQGRRKRIGGAWVPVEWDDDAGEYRPVAGAVAPGEAEPKEGDHRNVGGVDYVLRDGRWHRAVEEAAAAAAAAASPPPQPADLEIVEHVTRKGKTLRGVIRTDLDAAQAKAIDEYTFRKDGGWFIREKYLAPGSAPADQPDAPPAPDTAKQAGAKIAAEAEREVARRQAQAAKLTDAANRLGEAAQEDLGRDRLANTARRARMAGSATADAMRRLQLAETMRNLATAIGNGEAKYLGGVNSQAAVEQLDLALRRAMWAADRAANVTRRDEDRHPTVEDVRFARRDSMRLDRYDVEALTAGKPRGHAKTIAWLQQRAEGSTSLHPTPEQATELRALATAALEKLDRDGPEKGPGKQYQWESAKRQIAGVKKALAEYERLGKIGIGNDLELQRALAEFVIYRGGAKSEDPVKRMERDLVGKNVGVDFFPTPPALVERLVEEADIEPGMRVLEPSAGKGDIADALRTAGAEVDVVELSPTLQEILRAKGHNVMASDFVEFTPPEGGYDRIVMNPPFSNGMDADHVQLAYGMLKPGGRLVAITGEGIHFRQDAKAAAFRAWLDARAGVATKLPEGSFKSSFRPTGVATRVVIVDKPRDYSRADGENAAQARGTERRNFGWDAYQLSEHYTLQELLQWQRELQADPANANPEHTAGRSIHPYGNGAQGRRMFEGLSRAIGMKGQHAIGSDKRHAEMTKAMGEGQDSPENGHHTRFADAVAAAGAHGDSFHPDAVARHWAGGSAEEAADILHGDHEGFAVMPDGEHFMRMDDLLHAEPGAAQEAMRSAILAGALPERVLARLRRQVARIAEASVAAS